MPTIKIYFDGPVKFSGSIPRDHIKGTHFEHFPLHSFTTPSNAYLYRTSVFGSPSYTVDTAHTSIESKNPSNVEPKTQMQNPTRKDAVIFVDKVKSQFPEKYDRFLDIMRDLKDNVYVFFCFCSPLLYALRPDIFILHRIRPSEVVLQIEVLFDGYPDLARDFNVFLPPGYMLQPHGEPHVEHA